MQKDDFKTKIIAVNDFMFRLFYIYIGLFFLFLVSCAKTQATKSQTVETVDSTAVARNYDYSEKEKAPEEIAQEKILQKRIDSVCIAVRNSERLSIPERAKALDGFFTVSTCWESYDIDRDSLLTVALSSLVMSPDIVKYDLSKIFTNNNFEITHSEDNRLWAFTWSCDCAITGFNVISFLCWRDKNNKPQGYLTYFDEDNGALGYGTYIQTKLRSKKNLYLIRRDVENVAVVELTDKGINPNYPAFKTAKGYSNSFYVDHRDSFWWEFDESAQKLQIFQGADGGEIRTIFKFNGKEFVKAFERKEEN